MGVRDLLKKYEDKTAKTGWFGLKNDGDSCLVRMLNTGVEDLDVFEIHKVEIDGYSKAIKCKGDDCVLCNGGNPSMLKIYLPMQNLEADGKPVQIWERGKNDIQTIIGLIDENGELNQRDYKIKRNGKANDKKTTYGYFYKDRIDRDDLPAKPQIIGRIVLDLTEADMVKALNGTLSLSNESNTGTSNAGATAGNNEEVF